MEVMVKIFNLIIAIAAVMCVLTGAAYDNEYSSYFFIGGLVLFVLAGFIRLIAWTYYGD